MISVTFLNAVLKHKLVHPNDHWSFRIASKTKTVAISNGDLKRTIWERWLFGEHQELEGVPMNTTVEEALIFDAANTREWLENKMVGCCSAEGCKTIVKANMDELLEMMSSSFWRLVAFSSISMS